MNDSQLVEKILHDGQTQLFGQLVKRYSSLVYSKALSILHNTDAAADVTQLTFIKVFTQLDTWNGAESMAPWLSVVAVHLAINAAQKKSRKHHVALDFDLQARDDYCEEHEQKLQNLEKLVENLPDNERTIIQLHYYQKLTTELIAKQLNMTQSNVLVKLHRIREKLKQQLTEREHER